MQCALGFILRVELKLGELWIKDMLNLLDYVLGVCLWILCLYHGEFVEREG